MANHQVVDKTEQAFNTAGEMIQHGATVRQMQTTYATAVAVQKPRVLTEVKKRCLEEANLAGESLYYGWGAGKDRIEGPSVKCAMIGLRNWGNAACEMIPIQETPSAYIMTAAVVDLETGVTIMRQFRQAKNWTVYGRHDEARKEDIRFQIGQSKAQRNVILNFLPEWLIESMVEQAKEGVRSKLTAYITKNGIEAARQLALKALAKHSVTQERVEMRIGLKYGAWDIETLVTLRGDIKALDDGAESPEVLFPIKAEEEVKPVESKPGLSTENMSQGDPENHQGYKNSDENGKSELPLDDSKKGKGSF